jgi:hypothetical protein
VIRIFPYIEFSAKCPKDAVTLEIKEISIPGMRCLADGFCPQCGSNYYLDLPVSHALKNQVYLDKTTTEIYDSCNVPWFSEPLQQAYVNPIKEEIIPIVHNFLDSKRIIIINCLDFLYGHCLLKLLNVQRYLDNYPELGCCVIVPSQLVHLVPEGVAEVWEFPVPIKSGWNWYLSLEKWINNRIVTYEECFLSLAYSHPSNKVYDLSKFVKNLPDISSQVSKDKPVILFSYREDRLWGKQIDRQQKNIQQLYDKLHDFVDDFIFVLVGFGRQNQIKYKQGQIIDLRVDRFDRETDLLWLAYMSVADCVVGVHGSNMLLPSGLAKSTVELVPRSRLGNTVQDFLFSSSCEDPRDSLLFYRMLYGNEYLSNVYPTDVADLIVTNLTHAISNFNWFKVGEHKDNRDKDINLPLQEKKYNELADRYFQKQSSINKFLNKIKTKSKLSIRSLFL